MKRISLVCLILGFGVWLNTVGCTTGAAPSATSINARATVASSSVSSVATIPKTPVATLVLLSPSATRELVQAAALLTAPATLSVSPTATKLVELPTLPAAEVIPFVLQLLDGNNGCQLPCWWGATPGHTTWAEVSPLFELLNVEVFSTGQIFHHVRIPVPNRLAQSGFLEIDYSVRRDDDVIQNIQIVTAASHTYSLERMLAAHGKPSEIWLNTLPRSREGFLPFRLILIYQELGMAVQYVESKAMQEDSTIIGCFPEERQGSPIISLWIPDPDLKFDDILRFSYLDESQFYLPLEDATELDTESFTEHFAAQDGDYCLETASELWPSR